MPSGGLTRAKRRPHQGTAGGALQKASDGADTRTPAGRLFFHVMASLAQMERELLVERTPAGLAVAKARGKLGGRPRRMTGSKLESARAFSAVAFTGPMAWQAWPLAGSD